jgi:DNA repair protein RadC
MSEINHLPVTWRAGVPSAPVDDPAAWLTRRGLQATAAPDAAGWLVQGDTYPLDALLQAAGGSWDRAAQAWRLADAAGLARLAAALAAAVPAGRPGLAESAPSFEGFAPADPLLRRLLEIGPHALDDGELLRLLLGLAGLSHDASSLAPALIERFGSLGAVLAAEPRRLAELDRLSRKAIGLLKAVQLALERVLHGAIRENPIIGSWSALIDYLRVVLRHKTTEHLLVLYLDRKNRLIRDELQQQGTVDHIPLYPREILRRALELAASALILVHNHPSGDPTPSQADIDMTRQLIRALDAVDITLHDHVIVGRRDYLSLRAQRLI